MLPHRVGQSLSGRRYCCSSQCEWLSYIGLRREGLSWTAVCCIHKCNNAKICNIELFQRLASPLLLHCAKMSAILSSCCNNVFLCSSWFMMRCKMSWTEQHWPLLSEFRNFTAVKKLTGGVCVCVCVCGGGGGMSRGVLWGVLVLKFCNKWKKESFGERHLGDATWHRSFIRLQPFFILWFF